MLMARKYLGMVKILYMISESMTRMKWAISSKGSKIGFIKLNHD